MRRKNKRRGLPRWVLLLAILLTIGLFVLLLLNKLPGLTHNSHLSINDEPFVESDDEFTESFEDTETFQYYAQELEVHDSELPSANAGEIPDQMQGENDDCHNNAVGKNPELKVIINGDYLYALVTKETSLKEDYEPSNLQPIPNYMDPPYDMQLRKKPLEHLKSLWYAAKAEGVYLRVVSAYRSYEYQKNLFQRFADTYGPEKANTFSARAGQSEHQLGTTIDFGGTNVDLTADFADTDQGRWLAENAHKYGFAMSYPENKKHITGYIYEPWHYRYIGVDSAVEWKGSGLTLKEYLESKKQYFE